MTKRCPSCNTVKSMKSFSRSHRAKDGYLRNCKDCVVRTNELEEVSRNLKLTKSELKVRNKDRRIKRKYRITLKDSHSLLDLQNGLCALCRMPPTEDNKLCIDHCHETGVVRGLIHQKCNLLLGMANDSVSMLEKAFIYLQAWNFRKYES